MRPTASIAACHASHRRVLATLAGMTDDDFRLSSVLPRFSRGHVVTHLANTTRSHVRLFDSAAHGHVRELHPAGYDADRAADAGASRSGRELRADIAQAFGLLEDAWSSFDDTRWHCEAIMTAGSRTMAATVGHHWRDVEVHHVDLDAGYATAQWPPEFVHGELSKRIPDLARRADPAELLAWLLGRGEAPSLGPW
jgi:maleylpyruvate isomerase